MLHLTSQERKTVIFILTLLILGMGLDFLNKKTDRANLINFNILQQQLFDRVDINKATLSELMSIPGLGEKTAKSIIDYRKSQGEFEDIEELKRVKGIKDKKLEQLRNYIIISN